MEFLEEYSIEGFSNPSINYSSKNAMDPPLPWDNFWDFHAAVIALRSLARFSCFKGESSAVTEL